MSCSLSFYCDTIGSTPVYPLVQVWTWGEPWGDFSMKVDRSPKSVAGATDIVKIACGAFHNLCLNA